MLFESLFIYNPDKYPRGDWAHGAEIEDCSLWAADGIELRGWYARSPDSAKAVVCYFHGNGGNITTRRSLIEKLTAASVDVFAVDYRGYGRSDGKPTEDGLYQDADAAWDYLTTFRNIAPESIIVFGESLGGAVAIDLARRVSPAGLIAQSTFTSIPDMANARFPFLPRRWVCTQMRSIDKIGDIRCPQLFLHSRSDSLVPYQMGRELFDAAAEQKEFVTIENAKHDNMEQVGGSVYFDALFNFIGRLVAEVE